MSDIVRYYATQALEKTRRFFGGTPRVRVIIEGGYQDDWHRHTIDRDVFEIPSDTMRIHLAVYDLDLIARLDAQGEPTAVEKTDHPLLRLDYDFFFRIQRPTTLITEDGRIYHDRSLLDAKDGFNDQRLRNFLECLAREYGDNFKNSFKTRYLLNS